MRVLAVCTGNVARSRMIESVVARTWPDAEVASAGTWSNYGQAITVDAATTLLRRGYSIDASVTARDLTPESLAGVDVVIAAAPAHAAAVLELAPDDAEFTLVTLELMDPYGRSRDVYEGVLDAIEREVAA